MKIRCECRDPLCPVCKGKCDREAIAILYRVDMEDHTGTLMCDGCTSDALDSGLFRLKELPYRDAATQTGMYDHN